VREPSRPGAEPSTVERLPIEKLKGVGPKAKEKLAKLSLRTVQDVLFHLPHRYQDRTRVSPIGSLRPGTEAVVVARVELADVVFRKRRSLLCRVADGTGTLTLRFFHFSTAQKENLARGRTIRLFGEVRFGPTGFEMVHPEYELLEDGAVPKIEESLTPVYPSTEGVHQLTLRKLTDQALEKYLSFIAELLPAEVLTEFKFPTLAEALAYVHRPPRQASQALLEQGTHPTQQRLVFEEMLAFHLSLKRLREDRKKEPAPAFKAPGETCSQLVQQLPFALTRAQARVGQEIASDLQKPEPMQRLVQGDVGSGKTLVAALACVQAIEAGFQAAVMAPTELLAEQHFRNFETWLRPLGIDVAFLSGKLNAATRRSMLMGLGQGTLKVAVGTHALFQEDVVFHRLGLVVIDEQHRFGVHQRLALRNKGRQDSFTPHQLILTATPIPRTLAQAFYADLDVSVIDELPPGRTPVETVVVPDARRAEVVARVNEACLKGRQAYWVCPLIEESDLLQAQAATETHQALREALTQIKVALVHGQMKSKEKDEVMRAFKAGDIQLLVATTVIEVGVDVPNASLMIVENAERLGLSQLHQLRGRVGRGAQQSSCVLLYAHPLSETARERLSILRQAHDGFEIARKDLEMRGPGEVLGTRQTGEQQFHIADLVRDQALIPKIERAAQLILEKYPDRASPLVNRWLGAREHYAEV
jgi:ATP-dependent DNA helicase RecG